MTNPRVIFDNGPLAGGTAFRAPRRVVRADTPEEIPQALIELENAQNAGYWLAGYASYELGYLFSKKLQELLPAGRDTPLLQFGVFDGPEQHNAGAVIEDATLSAPKPLWTLGAYSTAFSKLHDYIEAGDVYQANLTFPLSARRTGSIDGLYAKLQARQQAPHGALVDLGGPAILSRSPELFFSIDADGLLTARPMKGTASRGATVQEDKAQINWLQNSEKNRAENLMIVDLLRNDVSRISKIGTVKVPLLFTIDTFATLHQMSSEITAELRSGVSISEIFAALFPCGSITGAPKIRAMQIISELEDVPRDAYCGAIGWISPDGAMSFNVAIRTLICDVDGGVRLNVGGGVVYDSTAEDEYAEALLKSQFALLP